MLTTRDNARSEISDNRSKYIGRLEEKIKIRTISKLQFWPNNQYKIISTEFAKT